MTITETRPPAAAPQRAEPTPAPAEGWLSTADHKRLGLLFIGGALTFLALGGLLGILLRGELAEQGTQVLGGNYFRTFSMHATVLSMAFLAPLWIGLGTYLVPLQIGAARLALPRLHALALWLYLVGAALLVASYVIGPPDGLGLTSSIAVTAPRGGANTATSLWIASLVLLALSTLLAAADLVVTVLTQRTPGLTLPRLPLFTWGMFVTSLALLLATPVFIAGLVLLYFDQHLGGSLFRHPGGQAVWQHTLWLFGRPEVYLLTLPGLGAACEIVATHTRRPLVGFPLARAAIAAFGALSFTAWAAGTAVRDAVVLPTYTPLTTLVALPVGLLVLVWLGSAVRSRPRFHVSLAFVAGFVGLLGFGALNAIVAAAAGVRGGTAWTTAHVHVVAFGAPTALALAALYHWAPKLWGRQLAHRAGALVFLLVVGGFLVNGLGTYLLGYDGAPARVRDYADEGFVNYSRMAAAGGILVGLGSLLFLADALRTAAGARHRRAGEDDPYGGLTLEWATSSPPPPHNFDAVPEVRSAYPLHDLRAADETTNGEHHR